MPLVRTEAMILERIFLSNTSAIFRWIRTVTRFRRARRETPKRLDSRSDLPSRGSSPGQSVG